MGLLSGLFNKKAADTEATKSKEDVSKSSGSTASASAETAFSEALNAKSGSQAIAALESASPEERKAIAGNATLMKQMSSNLDAASCEKCNALLGQSAQNNASSGGKWYSGFLSSAQNFFNGGKEVVTNLVESGKETVSNVKDYFQNLDVVHEVSDVYHNTIGAMPDSTRDTVLTGGYSLLSQVKLPPAIRSIVTIANRTNNTEVLNGSNSPLKDANGNYKGYIEDQGGGTWADVKYSTTNLDRAGCGIMATYNALYSLGELTGENVSREEVLMNIISNYEQDGAVLGGQIGTAPTAVLNYFLSTGHDARMTTDLSSANVNTIAEGYDTYLMVGLWFDGKTNDIGGGHWVSVTREDSGKVDDAGNKIYNYVKHNDGDSKAYPGLYQAVCSLCYGSSDPFTLIGVKGLNHPSDGATATAATTAETETTSQVATTEPTVADRLKKYATGLFGNAASLGKDALNGIVDLGKAAIPTFVSNDTVVGAFDLMRNFKTGDFASKLGDGKIGTFIREKLLGNVSNIMTDDEIEEHRTYNQGKLEGFDGYIENQGNSFWKDVKFGGGESNINYSGCEIIATYNVLYNMGENPNFPDLIAMYEKDGMTRNGQFGTAPNAIYQYFKKNYNAEMMTDFSSDSKIEDLSKNYTTFIATVYNDPNDITAMIHTVNITKETKGGQTLFTVHNAGSKLGGGAKNDYTSLKEAMAAVSEDRIENPKYDGKKDRKDGTHNSEQYINVSIAKPISLIAINK